jgi:hypothetical protein
MMTNYNESIWRGLGHPAFDMDYELAIDDVEWWNAKDEDAEETDSGRRF